MAFVMIAGGNDTTTGLLGGAAELLTAFPDAAAATARRPDADPERGRRAAAAHVAGAGAVSSRAARERDRGHADRRGRPCAAGLRVGQPRRARVRRRRGRARRRPEDRAVRHLQRGIPFLPGRGCHPVAGTASCSKSCCARARSSRWTPSPACSPTAASPVDTSRCRSMPARRSHARHDHDAGGDAALLAAKAALREQVWADLDQPGVARFPKPANRIPNFVGAEAAARRLAETEEWAGAATVKSNPDSPQWPVRQRALVDGKVVYMAVPRLRRGRPVLPARSRAARRRSAHRELDQGRGAERAHGRRRRARTGRSRRHGLCRGRRVRGEAGKGRRLQRSRARGGCRSRASSTRARSS